MTSEKKLLCYNRGCGQEYDENKNNPGEFIVIIKFINFFLSSNLLFKINRFMSTSSWSTSIS